MNCEIAAFEKLRYIIKFPKGYKEEERCPVIIFLHGAGSRGNDIEVLRNNPYFKITDKYDDFPFITIAPLCFENTWFDLFDPLKRLVLHIVNSDFALQDRIYVTGASLGGYATWQLAMSMPEVFAAIVPICGGGMYWNAARLINVPIWAFHGKKDNCVFVDESVKMVNAVNANGGNAKLTIYSENGHDAWSDTYGNPEVFKWLLTNINKNVGRIKDIYNNSEIYG